MLISGVQKFTILDYPGKVACMAFTPYCNFRCGYCHNSEFVLPEKIEQIKNTFIPDNIFFNFLKTRVGLLDGVVVSGGEPTLQKDLKDFIKKIKEMGFLVKLDTNGSNFDILENLINEKLIDFVAMDVKAPVCKYDNVANFCGDKNVFLDNILKSIEFIINSEIDYEFRTTIVREQLSYDDLIEIGDMIKGSKKYALQRFRNDNSVLDPGFQNNSSYNVSDLEDLKKDLIEKFGIKNIEIR